MNSRLNGLTRCLWVLALLVSSMGVALAQQTISGTITDSDTGEPLIGASILVVGTSTGTITDYDGNYELVVPDGSDQIRVSYTGYSAEAFTVVPGQATYDFQLGAGELLDEVVVVGYGTQTQSEVTSAVTSIDERDFNQGVVNNPTQLVQGKVAGLRISSPSGDPNAAPSIRLRGLSTFGANSEPLVIIDGVIGASLNTVDPSDIASIDVLKDGSAAAIYGTRASSGVIIVTTKRGVPGETSVTYRVQGGVESLANTIPVASASEYAEFRPDDVIDPNVSNDYYDELTRAALSQIHNVSLSGGVGNGSYRASLNYRDVEGVAVFSGFDQLNGRINVNQSALDGMLDFNLTASATRREEQLGFSNAFQYATIYNPTVPIRGAEDGDFDGYSIAGGFSRIAQFDFFNPIAINEQNSRDRSVRDQLLSGRIAFKPIDGLEIAGQYSTNITNNDLSLYSQRSSDFPITGANVSGSSGGGLGIQFGQENRNTLFEATATYDFELNPTTGIEVLAGYSFQDLETDDRFIQAQGFVNDLVGPDNFGLASSTVEGLSQIGTGGDRAEIESYFGRVQLDFNNTYFLAASLRQDGSTRFGADEKTGLFPAVSAGVNLGSFVNSSTVDLLKLRAGYGVTGAIPEQSQQSISTFNTSGDAPGWPGLGPGTQANNSANPALRFERKGEFNAGLDFAFADYRWRGTIDYFTRVTEGLLFNVTVAQPGTNAGSVLVTDDLLGNLDDTNLRNRGVEFTLAYDAVQGEAFSYTPRIVISHVRTELIESDDDQPVLQFFPGGGDGDEAPARFEESTSPGSPGQNNAPTQIIRQGERLGQIYTYVFEGINEDGSIRFADLNNDGMISTEFGLSPDKQVVGQGLPDLTVGFANEFTFGNFDANVFFRGAFGHSLANMPRNFYENTGGSQYNVVNTDELLVEQKQASFNSRYVEKADFVVLDNASIGYNFKVADERISNIYLGLAGRNLFYITGYSGVSPEVRDADFGGRDFVNVSRRGNILAPGIDRRNNYFRTRSFNLSASVTF